MNNLNDSANTKSDKDSTNAENDKVQVDIDFNLDFKFDISPKAKALLQNIRQIGQWAVPVSLIWQLLAPGINLPVSPDRSTPLPQHTAPVEQVQPPAPLNSP